MSSTLYPELCEPEKLEGQHLCEGALTTAGLDSICCSGSHEAQQPGSVPAFDCVKGSPADVVDRMYPRTQVWWDMSASQRSGCCEAEDRYEFEVTVRYKVRPCLKTKTSWV